MTANHTRLLAHPVRDRRRRRASAGAASAELHADRRDGVVQRRLSRPARRWPSSRRWRVAAERPGARLLSRHGDRLFQRTALIVMIGMLALQPRFTAPGRRRRDGQLGAVLRHHQFRACGCSAASIRARLPGLEACYVAAIPFFQNTVAGDLFYAGLLFGGFALLETSHSGASPGGANRTRPDSLKLQLCGPVL